jgi:ribosomal protein L37E
MLDSKHVWIDTVLTCSSCGFMYLMSSSREDCYNPATRARVICQGSFGSMVDIDEHQHCLKCGEYTHHVAGFYVQSDKIRILSEVEV